MDDAKRWLDRTLDTAKKAAEAGKDMVQRNFSRATLKVDLGSLRRSLDDVHRDIGRVAVERIRAAGSLAATDVGHLLRRRDEIEAKIAEKEREIADLETTGGPDPSAGHAASETPPAP
jgi:hypothetical protein